MSTPNPIFNLFSHSSGTPLLPALNFPAIPQAPAPVVAPRQVAPVIPQGGQQNQLDLIKALGELIHPTNAVAQANQESNRFHTLDEWHQMFAPSHPQAPVGYAPSPGVPVASTMPTPVRTVNADGSTSIPSIYGTGSITSGMLTDARGNRVMSPTPLAPSTPQVAQAPDLTDFYRSIGLVGYGS